MSPSRWHFRLWKPRHLRFPAWMVEVESIFGQIKHNKGFRLFLLRGLEKVEIEFGLIAIAHNLQKLWKLVFEGGDGGKFKLDLIFTLLKRLIFMLKSLVSQKFLLSQVNFVISY
jgi:hypothetical protein